MSSRSSLLVDTGPPFLFVVVVVNLNAPFPSFLLIGTRAQRSLSLSHQTSIERACPSPSCPTLIPLCFPLEASFQTAAASLDISLSSFPVGPRRRSGPPSNPAVVNRITTSQTIHPSNHLSIHPSISQKRGALWRFSLSVFSLFYSLGWFLLPQIAEFTFLCFLFCPSHISKQAKQEGLFFFLMR
ncbi:hypothetical protein IWX47DRAFT_282992 [Phyllosticta citricarpa]